MINTHGFIVLCSKCWNRLEWGDNARSGEALVKPCSYCLNDAEAKAVTAAAEEISLLKGTVDEASAAITEARYTGIKEGYKEGFADGWKEGARIN